jgi:hypothetical protein
MYEKESCYLIKFIGSNPRKEASILKLIYKLVN